MNVLGVQGFTIREYMADQAQFEETLDKIRAIGYNGLQLRVPKYLSAKTYGELLCARGIKALTVGSDVYQMLENPKQAIDDALEIGAPLLFVRSIPESMRRSEAGYHLFAADLNKAGKLAAEAGLKITYHAHAFEFCSLGGYTGMDILLNETDGQYVEWMPDTHWIACAGMDPASFIRRLIGRCTQVHFKDYAITLDQQEKLESVPRQFAEVGEGNLDWPGIIRACREIGVETFVVEQDICPIDPFTSLTISFKAMKRMGL